MVAMGRDFGAETEKEWSKSAKRCIIDLIHIGEYGCDQSYQLEAICGLIQSKPPKRPNLPKKSISGCSHAPPY